MKNFKFKIYDNNYNVKIVSHEDNQINLEVNGTAYTVEMKSEVKKPKTPTLVRSAAKTPAAPKVNPGSANTKVVAPIPGVVVSVDVKIGDEVKVDDRLLVLDAMKMENHITAEKAGTVSAIHVTAGQQVLQSDVLIELS
ncbi:biotin/lipoyl-binding protein [Aureibaculum marinum]|uniref:Biotin/lipoyl-binding protein n=1 Tax=Aureibaculum marinum TaxID=2487930 RepID=A0A3N4NYX8_9FLAO|nr:biotin/lipoyl-containing protein [Aureibaculum marinum]RPE00028.1 biotin/lipoyl-binding protein [Aureibaculum marinum]